MITLSYCGKSRNYQKSPTNKIFNMNSPSKLTEENKIQVNTYFHEFLFNCSKGCLPCKTLQKSFKSSLTYY